MDSAAVAPALAAVLAALGILLVGGVGSLAYLAVRPAPPWQPALLRLAAGSPWRWTDLGFLLALFGAAQLVRRWLPGDAV